MARIAFERLAHAYAPGQPHALTTMDMVWEDAGAYALLGPSGCGKTTLLNIVSGLIRPSEGAVLFDGQDVTALPTERRNVAQVFQFPVVYDTMTVRENLAFPLRNRGLSAKEAAPRVERVAALLGLRRSSGGGRATSARTRSRRSRSAAGWCATMSPRSCSTSRSPSSTRT
jgi:glycerol transport system ATP-binding protein